MRSRAPLFHGIEFPGNLRDVSLEAIKIEVMKEKIQKWRKK